MYDGYVFFCNKSTRQKCLSTKHYTCADEKNKPKGPIKVGSVIFLYDADDKTLVGPFTALTTGADELDAGTWAMDVETHIPSEDLKITWEDLHIIKDAPGQLPFLLEPNICKLSTTQIERMLDLLRQGELYLYAKDQEP
ncbi:MAG: hypothetical protein ACQCN6_14255 [Candidatus Bathyarchaeia archaeon]|jgi:hypothetical protein